MFGKFHPHVHEIPRFTGIIPMVLLVKSAMPGTSWYRSHRFQPGRPHITDKRSRIFRASPGKSQPSKTWVQTTKRVILTRKTVV